MAPWDLGAIARWSPTASRKNMFTFLGQFWLTHGPDAAMYHGTTVRHRLVFIAGAARWQLLLFLAGGPALFYLPRPHFIFSALARALPLDENWQGQSQQNQMGPQPKIKLRPWPKRLESLNCKDIIQKKKHCHNARCILTGPEPTK